MPVFEYKALSASGRTKTGILDADSQAAVRRLLRDKNIYPVEIREIEDRNAGRARMPLRNRFSFFNSVRPADIAMVTRQLATLVGAGFPLDNALGVLVPQTRSSLLKKKLAQVKDAVTEGSHLSTALADHQKTFPPLFVNMIRAGESSGTLAIVLERLADITEKQQAIKNQIRAAMAYPVLMAFIGAVVLFLLLTFIVPSITSIFEDVDQALPLPTVLLLWLGSFFRSFWWGLLLLVVLGLILFRWFRKTRRGTYFVDRILLKAPVLGGLSTKLGVARFARTLASLLQNGVSLLVALDIVKGVAGNIFFHDTVSEAAIEVSKGQNLAKALSRNKTFPDLFIQMVSVGEQTGELEGMLEKIAVVYEKEVETSVVALASLIEPLMILVMGLVVGFIVLSICLPILEMNQLVA